MTDSSRKAQEQAERMKAWFKERAVPKEVDLNGHGRILDTNRYIENAVLTLENSTINTNAFRASYFRLYNLKKELEK